MSPVCFFFVVVVVVIVIVVIVVCAGGFGVWTAGVWVGPGVC